MQRIRCAIFIDFDNMYSGIRALDEAAAERFAEDPAAWLSWIETRLDRPTEDLQDARRTLLLRLCYLSPHRYGKYRSGFVRAGFQVVDCPPLTSQGKNSADIRMVLDMVDALEHETRFDEFILMSSDADFTPVLLRLRTRDRRTTIITSGYISAAYRGACDLTIDSGAFIEDALRDEGAPAVHVQAPPPVDTTLHRMARHLLMVVTATQVARADALPALYKRHDEFRRSQDWLGFYSLRALTEALVQLQPELAFDEDASGWSVVLAEPTFTLTAAERQLDELGHWIARQLDDAIGPLPAASLAQSVLAHFGDEVRGSFWYGHRSFSALIQALAERGHPIGLRDDGAYVGLQAPASSQEDADPRTRAARLIVRLNRLLDLPRLDPVQYRAVFDTIAGFGALNPFNLTDVSRRLRDELRDAGHEVSRGHASFVLKGLTFQHYPFEYPDHEPEVLAETFMRNVKVLCLHTEYPLDEEEQDLLGWLLNSIDGAPDG
ncbi:MAG: NYN domain-containing protein [bacterium]